MMTGDLKQQTEQDISRVTVKIPPFLRKSKNLFHPS